MDKIVCKLLVFVVIVSIVFTGVASAERFYGDVYGDDGRSISGVVVIQKSDGWGISSPLKDGKYDKSSTIPTSRYGQYTMRIDDKVVETKYLTSNDWREELHFDFTKWRFYKDYSCNWDHKPPTNKIPEFSSVALPIAAVLGLVFFFQQKNNKKE